MKRDEEVYKSEVNTYHNHNYQIIKLEKDSQSNHTRKVDLKTLSEHRSSCNASKQSCEMKEVM